MVVVLVTGCSSSSPSPSGSPSFLPSAAPSATEVPGTTGGPPPAPIPTPGDPFLGQVVVTVSKNLRVRSEPRVGDDSIKYEPLLPLGTELKVLANRTIIGAFAARPLVLRTAISQAT